jgi:hypothetical protein
MEYNEIKEYIRKQRNEQLKSALGAWFVIGAFFSSFFAFAVLISKDFGLDYFWQRILGALFVFVIGILISLSKVFWIWLLEIKYYNPNRFNVEIVRIEDKKTTNHWQEDMENDHFKLGVTCSLKINGRYYGCSNRVYMRADKGSYYTVVFSGKKKKWNSHIIGLFPA